MKNTSAIVQENNLSRYSYISVQKPNPNHDVSEYFPDSTDKLVSEILKARADRLTKQKFSQRAEKVQMGQQVVTIGNYHAKQISEIMPISKLRSGFLNQQLSLQKSAAIQNTANNPSKQQKQKEGEHLQDLGLQKIKPSEQDGQINIVIEQNHQQSNNPKQSHSAVSSNIEYQEDKRPKEEQRHQMNYQLQASFSKAKDKDGHFTKSQIKFELPKVENMNNQSIDLQQKDAKIEASRAISEPVSDYLQFGAPNKSITRRSILKDRLHSPSSQNEKIQNVQFYKNHEDMDSAQSKIQLKSSQHQVSRRYKEQNSFSQLRKQRKNRETDRQVVQALNDRLNQINQIQEAEAISKRISSDRNQSSANFPTLINPPSQKKHQDQGNFVSQLQTEQSDDLRDLNILQHHYQSNTNLLQKQVTELLELHQAMIMQEECKQLRRKVKNAEQQNIKYKIKLRNASYSKRFNFHSPIAKNNNKPLQFYKKFTVSENLAVQYYEVMQKIAEEKKEHARLQHQYKVISDFQELMRNKEISSYPPLPFDLQYDSELGKYRTTKIGFFRQQSQRQFYENSKNKKYEFSKTKRKVKLQEQVVEYYDLLNYKRDICKDTILEFQVFYLGRVKKIKDQTKLISKQIGYLNHKIEETTKLIQAEIDKIEGPRELPKSQYFLKSKKSFSRSPPLKQTTNIFGISSPRNESRKSSQVKILSKKRISLTKSHDKCNFGKKQTKASIIAGLKDDYGLSNIQDANNQARQIPTFGKAQSQMLVLKVNENRKRGLGSPMTRKVNYIKLNKELLTRTQLNIQTSKSNEKLMSQQVSPIKKQKNTVYNNQDQSKSSNV